MTITKWITWVWSAFLLTIALPGYILLPPWSLGKLVGAFGVSIALWCGFLVWHMERKYNKKQEETKS